MRLKLILYVFFLVQVVPVYAISVDEEIDLAMAGDHRDPEFIARDKYRNPKATLKFMGLETDMTVVEIWPGMGWYTEILAPFMRGKGILYVAGYSTTADRPPGWRKDMQKAFMEKMELRPDIYDHVVVTELSVPERTTIAPPGTTDMVLTFRNVHNWIKGEYEGAMFDVFYRALKSGGILGIVEHRANSGTSLEEMKRSGYVTTDYVKQLAENAGFVFEAESDINANPSDTRDHPEGVWTLPPTLRLCKKMKDGPDKEACIKKYSAIGESDRMTLRFRKPYR